jgi:hypothetical protein
MNNNKTLNLKDFLKEFIDQTLKVQKEDKASLYQNALEEEEKQIKFTSPDVKDEETRKMLKSGDIDISAVIEKLNFIRSGKSFRDDKVKSALQTYFEELEVSERVALFSFLKGLAQIVTQEIPGEEALAPKDDPALISMKKNNKSNKVVIKPKITKAGKPSEEEDATGPAPIVPKK